ncbi:MAG: SLC13 family permease [Chlamydiae bacterium]|nr:SLC13 family permease [Chlamydiota bacterium]
MSDPFSFPMADILGKAESVFVLFVSACLSCFYKKKISPGLVFFTFACSMGLFGILPSKLLMSSLVNKVTFSLVCLYLVILAALHTGCIENILESIFKASKGKSLKFYIGLTAFASFFPSKRIQKELSGFLRKKNAVADNATHFLFPIFFVLASSLTLMGSVTNLVSDHITGEILGAKHRGFFTYGPISFSLFFASFLFFFYVIKMQARQGLIARFVARLPYNKKERDVSPLMERSSITEIGDNFSSSASSRSFAHKHHGIEGYPFKFPLRVRLGTMIIFLSMLGLTAFGLPLICVTPTCAVLLFFLGAFEKKAVFAKLPWDVFLLVIASFLFCHAFIETKLHLLIAYKLDFLQGMLPQVTFFLFASALLSLCIPSVMVVSFLLPIAICLVPSNSTSFMQLIIAAVTLGSFFLFPKKSIVSFDKRDHSLKQHATLIKLQLQWICIVYLVFIVHIFFL